MERKQKQGEKEFSFGHVKVELSIGLYPGGKPQWAVRNTNKYSISMKQEQV